MHYIIEISIKIQNLSHITNKTISKNIKIEKDKTVYIKLVTLQNSGLIGNLKDITNEAIYCSGYAIGSNEADTYIYKGYIKCGNNYKTEGYNASYDQN